MGLRLEKVLNVLSGRGDPQTAKEMADPKTATHRIAEGMRSALAEAGLIDLESLPDLDGWHEYLAAHDRTAEMIRALKEKGKLNEYFENRAREAEAIRRRAASGAEPNEPAKGGG